MVGLQFLDESGIVGNAGDDGDIFKVFGGGADHGGAADVDVFDEMAEGDAGLGGGLLKCVEIDDDHVDGLDAMAGDSGFVFVVAANVKQAAMDARVQRFDTAVEHLREAGEFADVFYGQSGFTQRARGAAGGDQLHAKAGEGLGEFNQAGFVGYAEKRSPNRLCRTCRCTHSSAPDKASCAERAQNAKTKQQTTSKCSVEFGRRFAPA